MVPHFGFDARLPGPPLDHPVGVGLSHALRGAGGAPGGAKQRPILVASDARRCDVFIQIRFEFVVAGRFMLLAALFLQPHPAPAALG